MPDSPNILWLTTDQQRFDAIGVNNEWGLETPNIDWIAAEGANFTNFFVNNPVCMPSRACINTGRYPYNHGVRTNGIEWPKDEVTLAHCLQGAGYRTAILGKLHALPHSGRDHTRPHPSYGYDVPLVSDEPGCYPDPYIQWVRAIDPALEAKVRIPIPNVEDRGGPTGHWVFEGPEEYSHVAWVADRTIEFVRGASSSNRPWFATAGFYLPHSPCNPPQHYLDVLPEDRLPLPLRRQGELEDKPQMFRNIARSFHKLTDEDWRSFRRYYYATCMFVDHHCGRILDALRQIDELDNTIIVYWSDHGDLIGDHWMSSKHPTNYDGIVRVPHCVRYPEKIKPGTVIEGLTECIDIMPTMLQAVGAPIPEGVDGASHWQALCGEPDGGKDHVLVQHCMPGANEVNTLRTKQFKYTHISGGQEVYIDLEDDPDEFVNRAADAAYTERLSDARLGMIDAMVQARDKLPVRVAPY